MSLAGVAAENAFSGTSLGISHGVFGSHIGQRSVLGVISADTVTVTSIDVWGSPGTDGGFTLEETYTAQGRTFWLYDKICDASEPHTYQVNFTTTSGLLCAFLTDWNVDGDAIRAVEFADMGSGTTLVLPSVSAAAADDLLAVVWDQPGVGGGAALAQAPLSATGMFSVSQGSLHWIQGAKESYRSNAATGTRSFVSATTFDAAVGVLMIIGVYTPILPVGGWGVGFVRMGSN